ncbi:MAG TPA: hypothetical protein VHB98_06065, partial [Chloroflexota bacterium]|nr:hypothetical protein [Chloroflexota bacterium]
QPPLVFTAEDACADCPWLGAGIGHDGGEASSRGRSIRATPYMGAPGGVCSASLQCTGAANGTVVCVPGSAISFRQERQKRACTAFSMPQYRQ